MTYIPKLHQQKANIVRKTRDTRDTWTTIAFDVIMEIHPAGGGTRFFDMAAIRQNLYAAMLQKPNTDIRQGDAVRRDGEKDLFIERIDTHGGVQELTLTEASQSQ